MTMVFCIIESDKYINICVREHAHTHACTHTLTHTHYLTLEWPDVYTSRREIHVTCFAVVSHSAQTLHTSVCVHHAAGGVVAEWVRVQDWRPGGPGFESCCGNFASELCNSVYPTLPMSFGGDNKSHRTVLSGVYALVGKIPHTA